MAIVYLSFFLLLLLSAGTGCEQSENTFSAVPAGILDSLINKTLEALRSNLANIRIPCESFQTGPQEFGTLEGHLKEVNVQDLDKFNIKVLDTKILDINNLTIVEEKFSAKGFYSINGTLAFPLGKNDIHFYGNGHFGVEFTNFSISMKLKIRYENGKKIVKDLDVTVDLEKFKIYLQNLMGGGELEEVFNKLLNDVGLTVFNYYKEPLLSVVKLEIRKLLNEMLNSVENSKIPKTSYYEFLNETARNSVNKLPISNILTYSSCKEDLNR